MLAFAASLPALNRSGFEISTGPAFRQDCIDWKVFFNDRRASDPVWNQERYPHLRMFDWMAAVDASWAGFHLQTMGDFGWFSSQSMQKTVNSALDGESNPAIPGRFEFVSKGRLATSDLRLGYQIDLVQKQYVFLPFAGWFYDQLVVRRDHPLPPFFQTAQNVAAPYVLADQSVIFQSKLSQRWSGPTLGAELFWRPLRFLSIDASYGYGWFQLHQTFEEEDSTQLYVAGPAPSARIRTIIRQARIRSDAQGQIARGKIGWAMSPSCIFNMDLRYFYLLSENGHETAEVSVNGDAFQKTRQKAKVRVNSASVFFEIAFRY